jgi:hypothetical protein
MTKPKNIRQSGKKFKGNTPTYFVHIVEKKVFDLNFFYQYYKTFSSSITDKDNKLESFFWQVFSG